MTLEFHPPGLRHIIGGSYSERRLKNREGNAVIPSEDGKQTVLYAEPQPLIEVYNHVKELHEEDPSQTFLIVEATCGTNIVPDFEQFVSGNSA